MGRRGQQWVGEGALQVCNSGVYDHGGMAERTMAAVLKTAIRATVSWVRIPLPPPFGNLQAIGSRLALLGGPFL